jgi:hypothetical protein
LLFRRVDAARQNSCFHRRAVPGRTKQTLRVDVTKARLQSLPRLVFARQGDDMGARAESGNVVCRIPRPSGEDFGRVILKNENWCLAGDPRHASVNELVGDQITDDRDATC